MATRRHCCWAWAAPAWHPTFSRRCSPAVHAACIWKCWTAPIRRQCAPTRSDWIRCGTLFIVSTKSGGTEETLSFFRYFYNWAAQTLGAEHTGEHFIAITDPGSKLVDLAEQYNFRRVWLNDPNIGGRYSALSYFGLVPAALCGADLGRLLGDALAMAKSCSPQTPASENPAAKLGAYVGEMAKAGRDKLTFFLSEEIASFGGWVEQLIAESTGKEGKGILPVVEEPLAPAEVYGSDRLFVHMHLMGDESQAAAIKNLTAPTYRW